MAKDASFRVLIRRVQGGDAQAARELVRAYEWAIRLQVRVRLLEVSSGQSIFLTNLRTT